MSIKPFRSACFFSTNNGSTVQRRANATEEQQAPLPGNVTNLLRLDESQTNNKALLDAWAANSTPFTMSGNNLLVNGQVAGIDPPGLLFQAIENASAIWSKLESTPDALTREEQAQIAAISFSAKGLLL